VEIVTLRERNELFSHRTEGFRLAEGGLDPPVLNETAGEVGEQRAAMRGGAFELGGVASMSHRMLPFLQDD
jgi:hypothetical protein